MNRDENLIESCKPADLPFPLEFKKMPLAVCSAISAPKSKRISSTRPTSHMGMSCGQCHTSHLVTEVKDQSKGDLQSPQALLSSATAFLTGSEIAAAPLYSRRSPRKKRSGVLQ